MHSKRVTWYVHLIAEPWSGVEIVAAEDRGVSPSHKPKGLRAPMRYD